jgi:hypothetical protein
MTQIPSPVSTDPPPADTKDFRIAVVTTAYTPRSHAHVITTRWVAPLPTDADYEWTGPKTRLASIYIMQKNPGDPFLPLFEQHGVRNSPDIADALTLGTGELAVDAVMIIGEHGDFPHNEFKQKLYPRKEMFDAVMDIIEASGKNIPIFLDKHFSWSPDYAREMVARIERTGTPYFGGSCTPHNPMTPTPPSLHGRKLEEFLIISWGELEGYLFHALEVMESLVMEREGGETGLKEIRAWQGESAWQAIEEGHLPWELLDSAALAVDEETRKAVRQRIEQRLEPVELFQLTYRDGLRSTIIRLNGTIRKWPWACRMAGEERLISAYPVAGSQELFHPHFARLSRRIEDFFLTRQPPIRPERVLFTTLACAACLKALAANGNPVTKDLP